METSSKQLSFDSKRKLSRASRSQLLSDSDIEDDSQEDQANIKQSVESSDNKSSLKTISKSLRSPRASGSNSSKRSDKSNNKKSADKSDNSVNRQKEGTSRTLRSRIAVDQPSTALSFRSNPVSPSVIPKKRQRISDQTRQKSVPESSPTNPENTSVGKAPNLGARLARNHGGREPQIPTQQSQIDNTAQGSSSSQQIQTGHPPYNLLRRSSRGKGSTSLLTTGSCVCTFCVYSH